MAGRARGRCTKYWTAKTIFEGNTELLGAEVEAKGGGGDHCEPISGVFVAQATQPSNLPLISLLDKVGGEEVLLQLVDFGGEHFLGNPV